MEAKPDPDIATTAVAMPIGGQVKDSSLRSLPMETFVPALAHVNLTIIWMESVFMVWFFCWANSIWMETG